jgi:hypothetical protein
MLANLSAKHGAAGLGDNLEDAAAIVLSDASGEIPRRWNFVWLPIEILTVKYCYAYQD